MSTIRRKKPRFGYVQILNAVTRDYRVSWRARGLLIELLSYPEGYETTVDELVKKAKRSGGNVEGRDAMRNAARELKNVGYIVEVKYQNELGHWITEQEVTDDPMYDILKGGHVSAGHADDWKPGVGYPVVGEPGVGGPGVNKKTEKKTEKKEGEEGVARAGASPDPSVGGDSRQWAVQGEVDMKSSLASTDLIRAVAKRVLTKTEGLTVDELQHLARMADEIRSVVDAQAGLDWDEYTDWLHQGWTRPDGRRKFNNFAGTLRWRLLPEQVQGHAVPWAVERRAAQAPSEASGDRQPVPASKSDEAMHESTCGIHGTKTLGGVCLPCQRDADEEERRIRQEQEDAAAAAEEDDSYDDVEPDPEVARQIAEGLREAEERSAQNKKSALQQLRADQAERERKKKAEAEAAAKKWVSTLRQGAEWEQVQRAF